MSSSYSRKSFAEITESILEQLTKGVVDEKHVYDSSKVRYKLGTEERVRSIAKVEGLVKGARHVFSEGTDYTLSDNMVEWRTGVKPDHMSVFRVSYSFGSPSPITDVNPGSVVRTIVEAIGREMEYLYVQMDYVYASGFIETATGTALDQVVALLGAKRRPPQKAVGPVVFGRKSAPQEGSTIEEVFLHEQRTEYPLKQAPVKEIVAVRGVAGGAPIQFKKGVDYRLAENSLVWVQGGTSPDVSSEFTANYKTYQQVIIPAGTKVSTLSKRSSEALLFHTTSRATLQRTLGGVWEAEVMVEADEPGTAGNVLAGAIVLMPKPVEGVEYVINRRPLTGGSPVEGDDELRMRARGELKSLGRATGVALKQRVEDVPGVVRPVKIQELPIPFSTEIEGETVQFPVPGVVRVIVDGGDIEEIRRVVEETRAAGVVVEVVRPRLVLLGVRAVVELERDAQLEKVQTLIEERLEGYIESLQTGDTVIFSRIASFILSAEGVRDVRSISVQAFREGQPTSFNENLLLAQDEKARLRDVSVQTTEGA
ncbi:MAG: baseplate J/gp47 family protein [Nitrososphaerota archaeon]|nr:baseplate J/gp47 family protein [Nitrososphaerota archaeon]